VRPPPALARAGLARAGLAALCLVAGAGSGVAAVAVHREGWGWSLGVAAAVAAATALPGSWWGRVAFCWSWAAVVLGLSVSRAEGDYLIAADLPGYGLLSVAVVLAVVGAATVVRRRARVDTGSAPRRP
jgi:hypothetical protein